MKPEKKKYVVSFAGIDQPQSIHIKVQLTEIGSTSYACHKERSKQERSVKVRARVTPFSVKPDAVISHEPKILGYSGGRMDSIVGQYLVQLTSTI